MDTRHITRDAAAITAIRDVLRGLEFVEEPGYNTTSMSNRNLDS